MDQDGLEKFIKNQVEQHNTSTDPDLLWQKIQAKQNNKKKKKRRFFFFWLFGGFGLLAGLMLLFVFPFSNNAGSGLKAINSKGIIKTPETNTTKEKESTRVANLPQEVESQAISQKKNSATITGINSESTTKEKSKIVELQNVELPKSASNANNTSSPLNSNIKRTNPITDVSDKDLEQYTTETFNSQIVISEKETTEPYLNTSTLKQTKNTSNKLIIRPLSSKEINTVSPVNSTTSFFSVFLKGLKEKQIALLETKTAESATEIKKKKWQISTGAAITYGRVFRSLSDKEMNSQAYLQLRESGETPLDALSGNLDIMLQHNNGFYFKSGIEYEQVTEQLDAYIERDSTEIENNQILAFVTAMDGVTSTRLGNGAVTTTYWSQKKIYNRYRRLEIPILLGYNAKKEGKKVGWFVEGGASVNLWFAASGSIFNPANELVSLKGNNSLFKTNTGLSLIGNAGLTYQLRPKLNIWASPTLRYRLSSVTSEINPIEQRYLNAGFSLGIRYHWSK